MRKACVPLQHRLLPPRSKSACTSARRGEAHRLLPPWNKSACTSARRGEARRPLPPWNKSTGASVRRGEAINRQDTMETTEAGTPTPLNFTLCPLTWQKEKL